MQTLHGCDKAFSHWYRLGRSRQDALRRKIDATDRGELLALLGAGRNRRDTDKGIIENLGFHVWMWNAAESEREAGLNVTCGLFSETAGLSNCVVLNFPRELGRLSDCSVTTKLLAAVATSWEPDWAGIFSNEAMKSRDWEQKPFVDWMVYVPLRIARVPPPSTLTHLENGGSLIIVQPVAPTLDNPEDLRRIREIEQIIRP
jgi:hypothetical protein